MNTKLLLILVLTLILMAGCGGKPPQDVTASEEPKGKVAPVMTVQKQSEPVMLSAMAVAEAGREAELSFTASGTVSKMHVTSGTQVRKGQVLAVLDTDATRSSSTRQLDIEDARRDLEQAEGDLSRYEALHQADAISNVELENKQRAVKNAASQLERAKISSEDKNIVAPFSGTVVEINRREGETASMGTPVMMIADLSEVKLTLNVSGDLVNNFKSGWKVNVTREDGVQAEGNITSVARVTDSATGKYPVEIKLSNGDAGWRGGMTALVEVPRTLATGLVIPLGGLGLDGEQRYVLVVENGVAQKRHVQVGQVMKDDIEILAGLQEGERVITGGIAFITEGTKIVAKGE